MLPTPVSKHMTEINGNNGLSDVMVTGWTKVWKWYCGTRRHATACLHDIESLSSPSRQDNNKQ